MPVKKACQATKTASPKFKKERPKIFSAILFFKSACPRFKRAVLFFKRARPKQKGHAPSLKGQSFCLLVHAPKHLVQSFYLLGQYFFLLGQSQTKKGHAVINYRLSVINYFVLIFRRSKQFPTGDKLPMLLLPPLKGKNSRVSKGAEKPQCHIGEDDIVEHDEFFKFTAAALHENVCVNDVQLAPHTDGNHYCLFHLPTKEKDIAKFEEIFQARLKSIEEKFAEEIEKIEELPEEERENAKNFLTNYIVGYDFRYVWFPSKVGFHDYKFKSPADFSSATFSARADFSSAIFSAGANFKMATFSAGADFSATVLAKADFYGATFSDTMWFNKATFSSGVSFVEARFSGKAFFSATTFLDYPNFNLAKFTETSQVFFQQTKFSRTVYFQNAVFAGYVTFEGNRDEKVFLDKREDQDSGLDLQKARLEKPERISFHRVRLCPSWFVNTDPRKMIFTVVNWDNLDSQFRNANIIAEINNLKERDISDPSGLLEIACRQLAVNAEENSRYEEASKFRYMAMETERLGYKWNGWFWKLCWLYWFSSSYGESWKRAILVLLGIILFFGVLYALPLSTFDYGDTFHNMRLDEGLVHSLSVAAFQRPEPKPSNALTSFFILLETIFAPLQAALLALAIRRKFMR